MIAERYLPFCLLRENSYMRVRGEQHPCAKLTKESVLKIREIASRREKLREKLPHVTTQDERQAILQELRGIEHKKVGAHFGISKNRAWRIANYDCWIHVP